MENHNPADTSISGITASIFLFLFQTVYSLLLSFNFNFSLLGFRIWTAWAVHILSGIIVFIINRKAVIKALKEWKEDFKNKC